MPAYLISDVTMRDAEAFRTYRARAAASIARYGGRYLARGGDVVPLEGTWSPRRRPRPQSHPGRRHRRGHVSAAPPSCDIIIAGGGNAGLALACALTDALGEGVQIAVADRLPLGAAGAGAEPRAFALSAGVKRMLSVLGVWPGLAAHLLRQMKLFAQLHKVGPISFQHGTIPT